MKEILITDVDNTLFDWVDIWYRSFSAMLKKLCEILNVDPEDLYPSISEVHQKYGTSEYSFLLEELPEVRKVFSGNAIENVQPAIDAFREARREALSLYPSVMATLTELKQKGLTIVAYTESQEFYTNYRFRKLGLDNVIDYLYSPPDHTPKNKNTAKVRLYPTSNYSMAKTITKNTPAKELKPNPDILLSIVAELGFSPDKAIYVGDSKMKDIAMAQEAGVEDAWAAYGQAHHGPEYDLLKKVTHWTPEMVQREQSINNSGNTHISPTHVLKRQFSEIIHLI